MMNWGVIGCASIAQRFVIPAIIESGNKLVAVASRKLDTAKQLAEKFQCEAMEGYENLLERKDIDAVYIPLPTSMHFEWVMNSLEAGKHVLVEKAASVDPAEMKQMVGKAKEKKLALVENFQFQHHAQNLFVKELLKKNEIGDIRCFRSSFGFPPFSPETNIRYKKELGGGALLDSGAYVLKATNYFFGYGFEVKAAHLNFHEDYAVDWFGGAFLLNKESGIFSEVAFGFDNYYQCNYEIWGNKGKITATRAFTAPPGFSPSILLEKDGKTEEIKIDADNHFLNMINHFSRMVDNKDFDNEYEALTEQASLIQQVRDRSAQ
jgi:dTDP-3,4-didehydro-2,6-dideoxy-alpha-D-glucose 3-reductase